MEERCRGMSRPTKFDKVVKRKICQRISVGTRMFSDNDDEFLLSIYEEKEGSAASQIGLCFACPSLSKIFFGQFQDDALYSR